MRDVTDKMHRFAENVAAGVPEKDALIAAGYSSASAASQASRLMARTDIRELIAKLRNGEPEAPQGEEIKSALVDPKSSLDVLQQLYKNPKVPVGLRFEAAKAALPYEHSKKGEMGKKEKADEDAKTATEGGFAPRRRPGRPSLRAVG